MVLAVTKMSGLMSSGGQSLRRFCPDALSGDFVYTAKISWEGSLLPLRNLGNVLVLILQ